MAASLGLVSSMSAVDAAPSASSDHSAGTATIANWNLRAFQIGFAEDQLRTFKAHRALALTHLAMHDAWNATDPRYAPYVLTERDPQAVGAIAAAQAAHDVLAALYPKDGGDLDLMLAQDLAAPLRGVEANIGERSRALGRRTAAAVLAKRSGDGWDTAGDHVFREQPGAYRTTPPWQGFVLQPGFRSARPFALLSASEFRPPPPPPLSSPEYAAAYEEVRRSGAVDSPLRTAEQTAYALWWMEFTEASVNRLARSLVLERKIDPQSAARLFALLNVAIYDAYIAVWDSKFEYDHWRPVSAIALAADDGNAATRPDDSWRALRTTPPFPDYVSAHATACAAAFATLAQTLGDGPFTMSHEHCPSGDAEPELSPVLMPPPRSAPTRASAWVGISATRRRKAWRSGARWPSRHARACSCRSQSQANGSSTTSAGAPATSTRTPGGTRRWRTVRPMGPRRSEQGDAGRSSGLAALEADR